MTHVQIFINYSFSEAEEGIFSCVDSKLTWTRFSSLDFNSESLKGDIKITSSSSDFISQLRNLSEEGSRSAASEHKTWSSLTLTSWFFRSFWSVESSLVLDLEELLERVLPLSLNLHIDSLLELDVDESLDDDLDCDLLLFLDCTLCDLDRRLRLDFETDLERECDREYFRDEYLEYFECRDLEVLLDFDLFLCLYFEIVLRSLVSLLDLRLGDFDWSLVVELFLDRWDDSLECLDFECERLREWRDSLSESGELFLFGYLWRFMLLAITRFWWSSCGKRSVKILKHDNSLLNVSL